ncbi:MAG: radical SAM protein [Bacteroidota bacterium]
MTNCFMGEKRLKLLLVNPINREAVGLVNDPSASFMPIGLGIIAALTPGNWDIELIDESFEQFTISKVDLVGLTSFTSNAPRAYEIASICRNHGIYTVMGGVHASMIPEEARNYVDTVIAGEAELTWPVFLSDFESGNPSPFYQGSVTPVERIPHVRRDIFKYPYVNDLIQTSRGCPMGCDFCSVTQLCGKQYRERDIEDVLDEMEQTTRPLLFIVDDHLVNNSRQGRERAIRLFKGMVQRGIKKLWLGQASMNFADDEEVLFWAARSGCTLILLGIEAETTVALTDVKKRLNLKRGVDSYEHAFKRIHKQGIAILGAMIFGMESDGRKDLLNRRDFIIRSGIDAIQASILTPLPGTGLFHRMKTENKIGLNNFPDDWKYYHFMHATMGTLKLTRDELHETMKEVWRSMYDKANIRKMMFKTLWRTRNLKAAYWVYGANHNYGRVVLEDLINDKPDGLNRNLEQNSGKRSLYLKLTDFVLIILYAVSWNKMADHFRGR